MRKFCAYLPWLLASLLWAQDQTLEQAPAPAPQSQTPAQPPASKNKPSAGSADRTIDRGTSGSQKKTNGPSNDRILYALPNFFTVEGATEAPRLSSWEKFKLTAQDSFDPVEFLWYGALAGVAQAEGNENRNYGQGARGYAERYAERFGDGTLENFMVHPLFGSILRQDPRYYQLGKGGLWHRSLYAITRVFITRADSGTTQFNFSEILGSGSAAAISTYTYHPHSDRHLQDVMSVWGAQLGDDAVGYIAKEFWPDLRRKLHRSKPGQTAQRQ